MAPTRRNSRRAAQFAGAAGIKRAAKDFMLDFRCRQKLWRMFLDKAIPESCSREWTRRDSEPTIGCLSIKHAALKAAKMEL